MCKADYNEITKSKIVKVKGGMHYVWTHPL